MRKSFYPVLMIIALAAAWAFAQSTQSSQTPSATQQRDQDSSQQPMSEQPPIAARAPREKGDKTSTAENEQLAHQVQQQLATDPALSSVKAEVTGNDTVTLTGIVPSKNDIKRAKQLAESVPGVKKVKEKLKVGGGSASAPAATTADGSASSAGSQNTAGTSANTAGSIAGNTEAQPGTNPMAGSTQDRIQNAIQDQVVSSNITVNETGNSIILRGTVPSEEAKSHAEQIALQYSAGKEVENQLTVASTTAATAGAVGTAGGVSGAATTPSASAQGTGGSGTGIGNPGMPTQASPGASRSTTTEQGAPTTGASTAQESADLKRQIENSLQNEQLTGVVVNVSDDNVELTGTVANSKDKQTAKRIAQSYAGNRKVVDKIQFTGQGPGANAGPGADTNNPYGGSNPGMNPNTRSNPFPNNQQQGPPHR